MRLRSPEESAGKVGSGQFLATSYPPSPAPRTSGSLAGRFNWENRAQSAHRTANRGFARPLRQSTPAGCRRPFSTVPQKVYWRKMVNIRLAAMAALWFQGGSTCCMGEVASLRRGDAPSRRPLNRAPTSLSEPPPYRTLMSPLPGHAGGLANLRYGAEDPMKIHSRCSHGGEGRSARALRGPARSAAAATTAPGVDRTPVPGAISDDSPTLPPFHDR